MEVGACEIVCFIHTRCPSHSLAHDLRFSPPCSLKIRLVIVLVLGSAQHHHDSTPAWWVSFFMQIPKPRCFELIALIIRKSASLHEVMMASQLCKYEIKLVFSSSGEHFLP